MSFQLQFSMEKFVKKILLQTKDINFEDVPALPSTTEYWTKWKRSESRSKWDFICWYEGGCKKWSSKDRADAGVNIKLYSSLKCIYEKLRDFIEEEGGKEKYIITKFEEYKFKSIKKIGRAHV